MEERKMIYLCLAHMSEEGYEQKYVKEAFDTNWVVPLGPNVNAFEAELEKFVASPQPGLNPDPSLTTAPSPKGEGNFEGEGKVNGEGELKSHPLGGDLEGASRHVVALASGTAAVHLALLACGVGPGDEVIVQSFTFCASSHPITYLGAKPVFVGSEGETWNMDPEMLELAIKDRIAVTGKKPKAIVPVALYGMPYRIDEIMDIANKYGIPVIEDAAEGLGSRYNGQVLGTFGKYGVLSFNGNKMITTSGGGALICGSKEEADQIMWYATQARDAYPYYQHSAIGYNYRMSNVCAGIGRGQMTVINDHIAHHKHVQALYEELLKDVKGIHMHSQPSLTPTPSPEGKGNMLPSFEGGDGGRLYDSNYWLCTATIDPEVKVKGQENAYKEVVKTAVGGAAGVIHAVDSATTDCQPNENVEALRMFMLEKKVECRPLWKPMHKQPVYTGQNVKCSHTNVECQMSNVEWPEDVMRLTSEKSVAYTRGIEEELFKVGFCLPAGPYVTDDDVRYIVDCIKEAII